MAGPFPAKQTVVRYWLIFSAAAIAELSAQVVGMIGDTHGRFEYRVNLVKVLTGRAVSAA